MTQGRAARQAALALLQAVLWRGEPLDGAIDRAFRRIVLAPDRGLARAIVGGVLRHLTDLDALIDSATARPLPADARARMVLRMALVQVLTLETPPHAVIATALPLLEGGPRRLVHGVLSALLKRAPSLPSQPSLPDFWRMRWGDDLAAAASAALAGEPPLDLSLRDAAETAAWTDRLGGTSFIPGHVRVMHKGRIEDLPGYDEGAWWVQDLAASLPARLLAAGAGEPVLDLCAAPGGKTLQLAAAGAAVTAIDSSPRRLERLAENLERTGLAATLVTADAAAWTPGLPPRRILLDAPCSGSGIFRRHPDVLYLKTAKQIAALAVQQAALLAHTAQMLVPGGTLVYCVCSLEPEEGEQQLAAFLAGHPDFSIDPVRAAELPAGLRPAADGTLRTTPADLADAGGIDGFFIVRMLRHA